MITAFRNLAEFEALRDDEKIDLNAIEATLDRLCFKKLNGILSRSVLLRRFHIRQWAKELGKITDQPITLRMTREEITPYMQEDGVICFCKKDIYRIDKLFMLLAHETAHFVLMQDPKYALIKNADNEYRAMPWREQNMHSPIELCANMITLMILTRCKCVENGKKKQKKIESCIRTLKKQLTK